MNFNALETARSITLSTDPQIFAGTVNPDDSVDYYRLQVDGKSRLQLTLTDLSGNANLEIVQDRDRNGTIDRGEIYARSGNEIIGSSDLFYESTNENGIAELINAVLDPGTYFIRVTTSEASTNYHLSITGMSAPTADIVWRHSQSGDALIWTMEGAKLIAATSLPPVVDHTWQMVDSADFNSDRQSDYVWRNTRSGENLVWLMNGANVIGVSFLPQVPDPNWQMVALADFNRDRHTDIVWRNIQSGENLIWLMNNATPTNAIFLPQVPDSNWRIVGAGDFNRDGHTDIVWRNAAGENLLWWLNETRVVSSVFLPQVLDRNWQIVGVADFDQNSNSDLLWRNAVSGENVLWFTQNGTVTLGILLDSVPDSNWQIVAAHSRTDQPAAVEGVGASSSTAFDLGILDGQGVFYNQPNLGKNWSFYQFTLTDVTQVKINLSSVLNSASFELLDAQQNRVDLPGLSTSVEGLLSAGTYFLRVYSGSVNLPPYIDPTPYRLSIEGNQIVEYSFTYYYNGQDATADYYSGTVVAFKGNYKVGQILDSDPDPNETGANGRYFITASRRVATIEKLNEIQVQTYYDSESNTVVTPTAALGIPKQFGEESGWINDVYGYRQRFGEYFEADLRWIDFVRVEDYLRHGVTNSITWSDTIDENVRIDLFENGIFHSTISESTESDGRYDWQPLIASGRYSIRITSVQDSSVFATSNDFHRLAVIQIVTPNGGEVLQPGSLVTITWLDDISNSVSIELWEGNISHSKIATATETDGSYDWLVPLDLIEGIGYRIFIRSYGDTFGFDWSDTTFTVRH